MKSEWLERGFLQLPHFKLILSEKEWLRETGLKDVEWIASGAGATSHIFRETKDGEVGKILVCIKTHTDFGGDFSVWLGLLVHEVSHFIDATEFPIGVDNTEEVKAYATQCCFLQLLWDYERQVGSEVRLIRKKKKRKKK